jgi:AraC-like DNA-binding protein
MRMVRRDCGWRVLLTSQESVCLQRLALKCGYRICEVCAELDCSERYFYGVCMRDIGLAPKNWLRRERMVVAQRMLGGGKDPLDVAGALGFAALSSFQREFYHFYNVHPRQFQREMFRVGGVMIRRG